MSTIEDKVKKRIYYSDIDFNKIKESVDLQINKLFVEIINSIEEIENKISKLNEEKNNIIENFEKKIDLIIKNL